MIVVLNGVLQFDQCHIVVMICNPVIFGMCDDLLNCRILFKSVHCVKVMFTLKIRINVSIWATANLPLPFTQKQSTDSNLALMLVRKCSDTDINPEIMIENNCTAKK